MEKYPGLTPTTRQRQSEIDRQTQNRLAAIRIPLRQSDPDAVLDLQALIDQVYENGSYGYDVDYSKPPAPPLSENDAAWAQQRLV